MRAPASVARRFLSLVLVGILVAPLLGALHQHAPDHDGATHHIEHSHGSHAPAMVETDDRLTPTAVEIPGDAGPSSAAACEAQAPGGTLSEVAEARFSPARAPPEAHRSRAPPHQL